MKHRRKRMVEYASMEHRREGPAAALTGLADEVGLPLEVVMELARKNELRCLFNPRTHKLESRVELRRRLEAGTLDSVTPTPDEARREAARKRYRYRDGASVSRARARLAAKRIPPWQVDAENLGS
jgi:hypothetical protein